MRRVPECLFTDVHRRRHKALIEGIRHKYRVRLESSDKQAMYFLLPENKNTILGIASINIVDAKVNGHRFTPIPLPHFTTGTCYHKHFGIEGSDKLGVNGETTVKPFRFVIFIAAFDGHYYHSWQGDEPRGTIRIADDNAGAFCYAWLPTEIFEKFDGAANGKGTKQVR